MSPRATRSFQHRARLGAFAVAEPVDAGGQPLEGDPFAGQRDPALDKAVVRESAQQRHVRDRDVVRVAGQRDEAERPDALAEQRPNVARHDPWVVERLRQSGLARLAAQVVAVVEDLGTGPGEADHCPAVLDHRRPRPLDVLRGLGTPQLVGLGYGQAGRDVAVQGVVRAGLVGDDLDLLPAASRAGSASAAFATTPTDSARPCQAAASRARRRPSWSEGATSSR